MAWKQDSNIARIWHLCISWTMHKKEVVSRRIVRVLMHVMPHRPDILSCYQATRPVRIVFLAGVPYSCAGKQSSAVLCSIGHMHSVAVRLIKQEDALRHSHEIGLAIAVCPLSSRTSLPCTAEMAMPTTGRLCNSQRYKSRSFHVLT